MSIYKKYQINDDELKCIPAHLEHVSDETLATELAEDYEFSHEKWPDEVEYDVMILCEDGALKRYKVYSEHVRRLFAEQED